MDIQGKVAIVTGASGGIGLATARLFADKGAKVVLAARSKDKLEQIAAELKEKGYDALSVPTDMRKQDHVYQLIETAVQHLGQIDILINNAGQSMAGPIASLNLGDFLQIFDLNVLGPIYAIQAVVPYMRKIGGGVIINISSMTSRMNIPGLAGYASTKAALNLISSTARTELAEENIRVITVYPRITQTEFGTNAIGDRELRRHQRSAADRPEVTVDTPEYVAEKVLQAVQNEPAEQYME